MYRKILGDVRIISSRTVNSQYYLTLLQFIFLGARFGQLQTKIGLVVLLANFRYTLNSETRIPLEYTTTSFVDSLKHTIYLNVEKVTDLQ